MILLTGYSQEPFILFKDKRIIFGHGLVQNNNFKRLSYNLNVLFQQLWPLDIT